MPKHCVDVGALSSTNFGSHRHRYNERDVALYALAVGCTEEDLSLIHERHTAFRALPSFVCASVVQASFLLPLQDIIPGYDHRRLLHGEMFTEFLLPLPTEGVLVHTPQLVKLSDLSDKKAAVAVISVSTTSAQGIPIAYSESTVFVRQTERFKTTSPTVSRHPDALLQNELPDRPPDFSCQAATRPDAAALYRLASQDLNPLHIDPGAAAAAGFPRPILHGLATLGIVVRCLMQEFGQGDSSSSRREQSVAVSQLSDAVSQLRSIKARFAGHVFPSEALLIEAWVQPTGESKGIPEDQLKPTTTKRIVFRVTTSERKTVVLSHAAVMFGPKCTGQAQL